MLALLLGGLLAAGAPPASAQGTGDCRIIDDFSKGKVGDLPPDWRVRKDSGKEAYRLQEDGGRRFLHAHAQGHGIQAAREYTWDLKAYPVLAWSWRAREFPRGAHEKEGRNDSVLAVYMLVPYSRIRGPKAVKYIWSEQVPVGTRLSSNGGLTQVRVLRSGAGQKGEWIEERVNVRDDYLKYFEVKDVPEPAGIAVLTDSDDTASSAQGDYASFRVCRE
jgi:hypothetical protein